jgi:hypothetical protein
MAFGGLNTMDSQQKRNTVTSGIGTLSMNTIRAKVLLSWLLYVASCIMLCHHHTVIAMLTIYPVSLLVRSGLPRPSPALKRLQLITAVGLILCLFLVMIDSYAPWPPQFVKVGEVVGIIFCAVIVFPLAIRGFYEDFVLLTRGARGSGGLNNG